MAISTFCKQSKPASVVLHLTQIKHRSSKIVQTIFILARIDVSIHSFVAFAERIAANKFMVEFQLFVILVCLKELQGL